VAIGVKRNYLGTVYQKEREMTRYALRDRFPGYSTLFLPALRADPVLKLRAAAVLADAESPLFERQM